MPTYKSKSNEPQSAGGITFRPGEQLEVKKYLNLNDYTFLEKKSDDPPISISSKLILENANSTTDMSMIYTLDNMKVLEVKDGEDENQDDDYIDLRVFVGHSDNQVEFVPYGDLFKFIRITQADVNGVEYPYWYALKEDNNRNYEENLIPYSGFPFTYPFFSIAIVGASLNGSVNIYTRDVRPITQSMV